MTTNDEPENLMVLPPLDDSLRDKIILLRAYPQDFPFASDDGRSRKAWRDKLSAELPAYLHSIRKWRLPADMKDQRYGVKAYQHPELLVELSSLAPEFRLLNLLDVLDLWEFGPGELKASASEVERLMREKDRGRMVDSVLTFPNALGVYLSRLERGEGSGRISHVFHGGRKLWIIKKGDAA